MAYGYFFFIQNYLNVLHVVWIYVIWYDQHGSRDNSITNGVICILLIFVLFSFVAKINVYTYVYRKIVDRSTHRAEIRYVVKSDYNHWYLRYELR